MRFVYLFKIYSNRIVKVKSAFLLKDGNAALAYRADALFQSGGGASLADVSHLLANTVRSTFPRTALPFTEPLFS